MASRTTLEDSMAWGGMTRTFRVGCFHGEGGRNATDTFRISPERPFEQSNYSQRACTRRRLESRLKTRSDCAKKRHFSVQTLLHPTSKRVIWGSMLFLITTDSISG